MKNSVKLLVLLCLSTYIMLSAAEKKYSKSLFKPTPIKSQQGSFVPHVSLADQSLDAETSVDDNDDGGATGIDDFDYSIFVSKPSSESPYMSLHELGLGAPPKVVPRITSPILQKKMLLQTLVHRHYRYQEVGEKHLCLHHH